MDERSRGERRQRQVMQPGATWQLRLTARVPTGQRPPAEQMLRQAVTALWLLTQYGGVGSKARKGFGSLAAAPDAGGWWPAGRDGCLETAATFQAAVGLPARPFDPASADPGSVADDQLQEVEVGAGRAAAWAVMDRVGAAYSAVAAAFKHDDRKAAFGLPRKIHGPMDQPLRHQRAEGHSRPEPLASPVWPPGTRPDKGRHASPLHLHVGRRPDGGYTVRLLALPARHLRSRAESVAMLTQFARGFPVEFAALAGSPRPPARGREAGGPTAGGGHRPGAEEEERAERVQRAGGRPAEGDARPRHPADLAAGGRRPGDRVPRADLQPGQPDVPLAAAAPARLAGPRRPRRGGR